MENMDQIKLQLPHVVFLAYPAQGHIKPLLKLAELLSYAGFQVTFVNFQQMHDRLIMSLDMSEFNRCHPEFEFLSMPNHVPPSRRHSHPLVKSLRDHMLALDVVIKPALCELLVSLNRKKGPRQPVTCIIADGLLSSSVVDLADEFQIPYFAFRMSASCIWTYFNLPKLIEEGDVPVVQEKDMDKLVTCIPGLENFRRRDLVEFLRIERADDPNLEYLLKDQTLVMPQAYALILNSFDEVEGPAIAQLASHFPKIYTLGPIHGFSNVCNNDPTSSTSSKNILRTEDRSCITWLDSQLSKSVIFVSFGTVIRLTHDQLFEFWHGLVNSGRPFLWVIRPESITGDDADANLVLGKLKEMIEDKWGLMVSWAPQEEVLAHQAIGGFLTHSGWNSTLESLYAGVPMLCWPGIGDQTTTSRLVSDVWKVGLDMKDSCDRLTIEKMVRNLMEDKREEIIKSVNELKKVAQETVKVGGASFSNLDRLIGEIRLMTPSAHT